MTVGFSLLGQSGRLKPGNQLFQIASTLGIARRVGEEPSFNDWDYRRWFSVPDEFFTGGGGTPAVDLVPHIDPRAAAYLQDRSLFGEVLAEVRTIFEPSLEAAETLDTYTDFTALRRPILGVHVRRGDNVPGQDPGTPDKHLYHPLPPVTYYYRAIDSLRGEAESVAVFSDDIEWCKAHLDGADYYHSGTARPKEHQPDYTTAPILDWIDWHLLATCDAHVLSNSTFGIFAAIVAASERVTYPWPIYGPNVAYVDASLMFSSHWTRMEVA